MAICYKDRTFCEYSSRCARMECPVRISALEDVKADMEGLPVAYADLRENPICMGFIDITKMGLKADE